VDWGCGNNQESHAESSMKLTGVVLLHKGKCCMYIVEHLTPPACVLL